MYRVIERLKLGRHRYGKYRVEYSIPWIDDAKNIYLVSIFTSYFPGRIKLVRKRGRGYAVLDLYEGVYPYFFVTSNNNVILDEENPLKTKIRIMPEKNYVFEASLSIIGLNEYKKALGKKSVDPRFIIHDEKDQAFIHKYLEYIVIRIYTLRDMFKQACLIVEGYGEICNNKLFSDKYRDYYQFILKNTENNIQYLFKLRRENNEYYFFGREGLDNQEYIVPDKIEGIRKPAWWIGAVYYQIFPDSFSRFPREFTIEECLEKRKENLLGGNIEGILKKIPYIVDLGVNAIYFTPIYRASSYHRYDVIDHKSIDNTFGDIESFKRLVDTLHEKNIKVILDLVVHHSSPCSKEFRDAIEKGRSSKYWDWYVFLVNDIGNIDKETLKYFKEFIEKGCKQLPEELREKKPFYESYFGIWHMPKYNHYSNEVLNYFKEIMKYWYSLGVDGFRVDVGHGVPDHFNLELYNYSRIHDRLYMLEIILGIPHYKLGEIAHTSMNYTLRNSLLKLLLTREIDLKEFIEEVYTLYYKLPVYVANSLYTLLGSHDTPRIKTLVKRFCGEKNVCKRLLYLLYAILFAFYGSPAIYYGDEIGMENGSDIQARKPMIWNTDYWDKELLEFIKELTELRKRYQSLRQGFTILNNVSDKILLVKRFFENEEIHGYFNMYHDYVKATLYEGEYRVLLSRGAVIKNGEVFMEPYGFLLVKIKR